jgi:cephalosporin hydroxylase
VSEAWDREHAAMIDRMARDPELAELTRAWFERSCRFQYTYHFSWLGRPIIQLPQDIMATQEIIWDIKPDLIIETGIAHGGSLILWASLLELLGGDGRVVGVDIEIRPQNRTAIEAHPLAHRITMVEGSSVDPVVLERVQSLVGGRRRVMVMLDSNHTHAHVRRELELYSRLVTAGSYLIVFDTSVEQLPEDLFSNRPWKRGNSPATAVTEFLALSGDFEVDRKIDRKLLLTVAPGGYLRRVGPPPGLG